MIFLYYQHHTSNLQKARQEIPKQRYPKHRLQIQGFNFDGHFESRKTISIKADKFSIEKKKLGFFRVGLINVAKLKNAVIDIYGVSTKNAGAFIPKDPRQKAEQSNTKAQITRGITFKDVFRKESLPSFSIKRISSIVIEPVSLNLNDEKSLVTQISAASATIRLKKRDIFFTGNVRVVSGSKVLTTDELSMLPENAVIRTDRQFVLKTPEKQVEGVGLTTDITLAFVLQERNRKE